MRIVTASLSALIFAGALGAAASGCGGTAPDTTVVQGTPVGSGPDMSKMSCVRTKPGVGFVKDGSVRESNTVALARDGQKLVAVVADKDAKRINLIDVNAGKVDAAVPLSGAPEHVLILDDGRVAVTIADSHRVEVFEPTGNAEKPLEQRCSREVPAGAYAIAASKDGKRVAVTSAFEAALTIFEGEDMTLKGAVALSRAPRGVLIDENNKAFVSHVVDGKISVVNVGEPKAAKSIETTVRAGSQDAQNLDLALERKGTQAYTLVSVEIPRSSGGNSFEGPKPIGGKPASPQTPAKKPNPPKPPPEDPGAPMVGRTDPNAPQVDAPVAPKDSSTRLVVPMISVDPGNPDRPTRLYYGPPPTAGVAKHAPVAILVDPVAEKSLSTHVLAPTNGLRSGECLLPRSIAYRQSAQKLYVTCMGVDLMLELDARAVDPMRAVTRRFQLPKGPTGVAVSETEGVAVVWGQFDEALAVIPLGVGNTRTIDAYQGTQSIDADTALGRDLFYRSEDARITFDGVACSSCHPDGGEDGVTWSTPEGMRQTPMLAGRLHGTAPYGWTRKQGTLEEYIQDTATRLGGTGLDPKSLVALAKFAKNLPTPPRSPGYERRLFENVLFDKGREVFFAQGCDSCHVGGPGVDKKSHEMTPGDREAGSSELEFDTPSLTRINLTPPYFHDGRYKTMEELLADPNSKMGNTSKLNAEERDALTVYLQSL